MIEIENQIFTEVCYIQGGAFLASRYQFNGWTTPDMAEITNPTSPATTVLMDKAKTVTANYVIQYEVTFDGEKIIIESNATITNVTATRNTLNFTNSGPNGEKAYINATIPTGLNACMEGTGPHFKLKRFMP
jgi:uncharacterized repeat protein (TIGR02543 family)